MSLILILFVLIVGSYSLFFYAQKPIVQAENEAAMIARDTAGVENVDDFFWYNGTTDSYFTVGGHTEDGRYLYVVIKQNGGQVSIFDAKEIVTEEEAKAILLSVKDDVHIMEARIGIEDEQPFWEVSYQDENGQLAYFLISARTGETIREYQNI